MLFAAFEKKWWKALMGDQDTMTDIKDDSLDSDLRRVSLLPEENSSLDLAEDVHHSAPLTTTTEWVEEEKEDGEELSSQEDENSLYDEPSSEYEEDNHYDLDNKGNSDQGDDFYEEEEEEKPKVRDDIQSVKEFFASEASCRFEILDEERRKDLIGRYRIEVRGDMGGVWTLDLNENEISISPQREEAELVLMLHSEDFLSIVNGFLNPQIALVSQRIKVSGDSKKASLFQNIMSPLGDW